MKFSLFKNLKEKSLKNKSYKFELLIFFIKDVQDLIISENNLIADIQFFINKFLKDGKIIMSEEYKKEKLIKDPLLKKNLNILKNDFDGLIKHIVIKVNIYRNENFGKDIFEILSLLKKENLSQLVYLTSNYKVLLNKLGDFNILLKNIEKRLLYLEEFPYSPYFEDKDNSKIMMSSLLKKKIV